MINYLSANSPFYVIRADGSVLEFKTYFELLNWISSFTNWFGREFYNSFLDNVGVLNTDLKLVDETTNVYDYRLNRVLDCDFNNVYCDLLILDVMNHEFNYTEYTNYFANKKHSAEVYIRFRYLKHSSLPEFRRGPIPYTGRKHKYKNWYRHIKTFNEIKLNTDTEALKYVRDARKNLPTSYDDIMRSDDKNWKRQGKYKHQWEKNSVCRVKSKSKYVIKNVTKHTYDVDEYDN